MIRYDCQQGGQDWVNLHLGRPSASSFDKIITAKTRKVSAQATGYAHEILASWLLGRPVNDFASAWMDRGIALEEEARNWYAFEHDVEVEQVGFITTDDGRVGCSPDGLIAGGGGIEIKTLSAIHHVGALLGDADEYILQIQGQMWVAELPFVARVYWNPVLPPVVQRIERDEELIEQLSSAVLEFCDRLDGMKDTLLRRGCKPIPPPTSVTPADNRPSEAELKELEREWFGEALQQPDFSTKG